MTISSLFGRRSQSDPVHDLYVVITHQSRLPDFYLRLDVPDTVDGRFDMITLHAFLVLHRLKAEGEAAAPFAQAFFDLMFADMDRNLREMGAGDMGVGRRVKTMVTAFYGRVAAYEKGLDEDGASLAESLQRNLYRGAEIPEESIAAMVGYVKREATSLSAMSFDALAAGKVSFGPPPEAGR
jgi:cytochrome b pre-mRNA-processing protein 3